MSVLRVIQQRAKRQVFTVLNREIGEVSHHIFRDLINF